MKNSKHIRWEFHSVPWVMPQGSDLGGAGGAQGVKKKIIFKHGHVAYQIDGDDEQNRMHSSLPFSIGTENGISIFCKK